MASFDVALLNRPLADGSACGPDLEAEGDLDYYNFVAWAEGLLPASYASFDRDSVDFDAVYAQASALFGRTRDLRLYTILAKLLILDRKVEPFAVAVGVVADLLETAWDSVHPQPLDAGLAISTIQALDDLPHTVLALQAAPLVESRRHGRLSYRSHLLANGAVTPRPNEQTPPSEAFPTAFEAMDVADIVALRDRVGGLVDALKRIEKVWRDKTGEFGQLTFPQLTPVAEGVFALLDGGVAAKDPNLARIKPATNGEAEGDGEEAEGAAGEARAEGAPRPAGAVDSIAAAAKALDGAIAYFAANEPSNPLLLLCVQARDLIGKSFMEALKVLAPAQADKATIKVGGAQTFTLAADRLNAITDRLKETGLPKPPGPGEPDPAFVATHRQGALNMLSQVATFFRATEPSSPIPLLIDRAKALNGRDFAALLQEVLPPQK